MRIRRLVAMFVLTIVVALVALAAVVVAIQDRLLYFPDPGRVHPADAGLSGVREQRLATDAGEVIVWRAESARPSAPVILYFHGNAGNLAYRAPVFQLFLNEGWGLAALSYRGYGGSAGRPSQEGNVADALALYDAVIADGVPPERIVLYGESLGSGVGAQVAARRPVALFVGHAPFSATVDVAVGKLGVFFAPWVMRDQYRSREVIGDVTAPFFWIHGARDTVVPIRFGRRLYERANEPKRFVVFDEAGHNDLYAHGAFDEIRRAIGQVVREPGEPAAP